MILCSFVEAFSNRSCLVLDLEYIFNKLTFIKPQVHGTTIDVIQERVFDFLILAVQHSMDFHE